MQNLVVVDNPKTWTLDLPDVPIVSARAYLTAPEYANGRGLRVFNLCRSYRYQSLGYYVSLLAMARGHRPLPSILTIQDMKNLTIARMVAGDLDELVQRSLRPLKSDRFTLTVYFGRNVAQRYDALAGRLFRLFEAPLLRAEFQRDGGEWTLRRVSPMPAAEAPESHLPFVSEAARAFFASNRSPAKRTSREKYYLAILHNPDETMSPSNKSALRQFAAAAKRQAMAVEFLTREDYGRIGEFDALFIRETTAVHHHTYRFARRAAADGLVVIDDPDSILQCTNKVFLCELLARHRVPTPPTRVLHRENCEALGDELGWPVVLKQPDSSFSQGVLKVETPAAFREAVQTLLERSELVIAQRFTPSDFDWRVGVLGGRVLYACKYHMAPRHWQIAHHQEGGTRFGKVEALPLADVPKIVLNTARRAAGLIGEGLYGVDLKQADGKAVVIEVNDNPNLDHGVEDRILGDALHDAIMQYFVARIEARRSRPES